MDGRSEELDDDEEVQRPVRQTLCGSLAKDANWKCLVLSLLIYACLGAVTWCRTAEVTKMGGLRGGGVGGGGGPWAPPSHQRPHPGANAHHPATHHHYNRLAPLPCAPACPPVIINLSLYPIRSTRLTSPCEDGYMYVPVAFLAMLYLLYLVECWHCTAGGGAGAALGWGGAGAAGGDGVVDRACLLQRVQEMRDAQPHVWWKAVCYHYVRRKRQVTRYRHGDAFTSTQVFYERVNSHAAGSFFMYAFCGVRDASPRLLLDRAGPITKVRFSKGFAFANVEAAAEFEEQRARFFREYERRDDYLEMHEGMDLTPGPRAPPSALAGGSCMEPGLRAGLRLSSPFRETATALADPARPPWFTSPLAFWLASCLLLSWPLRLLVEYNTAYVHYQVTKLFGVNYEPPSSATPTSLAPSVGPGPCAGPGAAPPASTTYGALSRGSTLDSVDLDWTIRDNCAVVPSYSEALLMLPPQPPPQPQLPQAQPPPDTELQIQMLTETAMGAGPDDAGAAGAEAEGDAAGSVAPTVPLLSRSLSAGGGRERRSTQGSVGVAAGLGLGLPRSSTAGRLAHYIRAPPLAPCRPEDPRGGRAATTPTEDPPPYEDALRLPALSRLRRSLTERGELCRRGAGVGGSAVAAAAAAAASAANAAAAGAASTLLLLRPHRRSEPSSSSAIVADVQQVRLARARLNMETSL